MDTTSVMRQLGCSYWKLIGLIRRGDIRPPEKTEGGQYWWSNEDVEAAKEKLIRRPEANHCGR
jgi:hypothetical protein